MEREGEEEGKIAGTPRLKERLGVGGNTGHRTDVVAETGGGEASIYDYGGDTCVRHGTYRVRILVRVYVRGRTNR